MDSRIPQELVTHMKGKVTIEDLVVEGLNSVYDQMMNTVVENRISFSAFVEQVTKAAKEYAEDCNQG